jgi:putative heme-binding domain-containing protein
VKWKGDKSRVVREIIEPSYHIDPAFAMHVVLTDSGSTVSGLLVEENEKSISLLESVQAKQPTVIERDAIEAHQKSSNSMMPKGLLDQFSRDEVLEIVSFILGVQKAQP